MRRLAVFLLVVFFFASCDSVTEPEEGGSGGSGGGGGGVTNRYITEIKATVTVMNSQTSQPVGGASVQVSAVGKTASAYSNSSGVATVSKDISYKIDAGVYGVYADITVSAPSFSTVTINDYLVELTFLESGSGWANYGIHFSHTVNITPDSGALHYVTGDAMH